MGCVGSKPEESPAVTLCRERCSFLDHAIHQRYVLSEAHLAYFLSLKNVGVSLHRFFDVHSHAPPSSPVLNLPQTRKGHAPVHHHDHDNHSNSGSSHLHFHDDSDSDEDDDHDSDDDVDLHSVNHSPVLSHNHNHRHHENHRHELPNGSFNFTDQGQNNMNYSIPYYAASAAYPPGNFGYPDTYQPVNNNYPPVNNSYPLDYPPAGYPTSSNYTMNYMRKQPTPSVVYQQRPMNPETIHYGEASSSSSYYNNNGNRNNDYSGYQNPNYYANNGGFNGYGEVFGESSSRQVVPPAYGGMEASTSKAPPPPPPPPPSSGWDFLNPFETYDSYYPPYTPSRDSREVREEEGIPDLEEEDLYQEEVVKEIHSTKPAFVNDKGASGSGGGGGGASSSNVDAKKAPVVDDDSEMSSVGELHYRSGPSVVPEEEPVEFEVHVVEKGETSRGGKPVHQFHDDSEVVKEIQVQFDRASESGNELAKILEVGKVPHNRKHAAYQVSSKMLNVFSPSLAVAISKHSDPADGDAEVDSRTKSHNLSSTLHKLYLWEKKLLEEVKVEEKMRLEHDEKDRRLKRLDEKGAEQQKIDATRILVRSLSTRIRIAIQVVDKISAQIDRLRDEELWPQLNGFIQGLTRMWRSMRECHHSQCEAIAAAKRLDAIASNKHASDECLEATLQLEHELLNWTLRFSCWFGAQKGFVTSLNNWLLKCLLHIPEETDDGPVPFSPSRIGAPTIFIICNQWAQAIDRISDKEVVNSMRDFVRVVLQLWDRDKQEMRRRFAMHKNMESKVKSLDREDQKIQKELQVLDKQIVLSTGEHNGLSAVYQSETSKGVSAQTNLRLVFEAMERFTAASLKACEDLLLRIEEDRISRQQEGVS
nr:nitrate regulatory gene2 protein-like [Tanacetum cinerariifolium]